VGPFRGSMTTRVLPRCKANITDICGASTLPFRYNYIQFRKSAHSKGVAFSASYGNKTDTSHVTFHGFNLLFFYKRSANICLHVIALWQMLPYFRKVPIGKASRFLIPTGTKLTLPTSLFMAFIYFYLVHSILS
jgi:hypothetical protein